MAGEAPKYARWIRCQMCCMRFEDPGNCFGPVEADHTGPRGLSQRAHDDTCIPLCHQHHMMRHALSGPFKGMRKPDLREWIHRQVSFYRRLARREGVSLRR